MKDEKTRKEMLFFLFSLFSLLSHLLYHTPLSTTTTRLFTIPTTMAANKDMINAYMVEAGFCINKHGGAYENVWRREAIEGGGAIQS